MIILVMIIMIIIIWEATATGGGGGGGSPRAKPILRQRARASSLTTCDSQKSDYHRDLGAPYLGAPS